MRRIGELYPVVAVVILLISGMLIFSMAMPSREKKVRPIDPVFNTEVYVRLNKANPEQRAVANIEYQVGQGWYQGWRAVNFFTTLDGELYKVYAYVKDSYDPEVFDPNAEFWPTWQERFAEVRKEAETGLKKGAEDIFKKKE